LLTLYLFIKPGGPASTILPGVVLYLQFMPSVVSFINLASLAASGFILVLLLTFIFGRAYCSFLCPLGILQDLMLRIKKLVRKRLRFRYFRINPGLRYLFLAMAVLPLLSGSFLAAGLLDPFSGFGRIAVSAGRPVVVLLNNAASLSLENFNNYNISLFTNKFSSGLSLGISLGLLTVLAAMTYYRGRMYCNSVCPVGTLLGWVAHHSYLRIRLDESRCNSCGLCAVACKAGCIDSKARHVDHGMCVLCFNCLGSCAEAGVLYGRPAKKKPQKPVTAERRAFIRKSIGIAPVLLLPTDSALSGILPAMRPVPRRYVSTPPGSLGHDHFNRSCIACHLCVNACPTQVLQPALMEYGLPGVLQPYMDFSSNYCNYDCTRCSEVCPSDAILPVSTETKKEIQPGIVTLILENCVVYRDRKNCGACSEHCPTKAVNMVPYLGKLYIPELDTSICVGCGACEYACPTNPKSIYVDGFFVHRKADPPKTEKTEVVKEMKEEDDFPF
jgi:polyferredoxin